MHPRRKQVKLKDILLSLVETHLKQLKLAPFLSDPIKAVVDPDGIRLITLLRRREIKFADISGTRLELAPQILILSIKERQSDKEIKLAGFKQIFHLSQLIRYHHERLFEE